MITLENITKKYNNKVVFNKLNIKLPEIGIVLVKGESGSGKTTLLNLISKIDQEYDGKIYYKDNLTISYMTQEYNLLEELNVKDNINIIDNNKSIYELKDIECKRITDISGGENKRASINRTFNKNANVYILDEPTESLDKENINILKEYIKEKSKSSLIIISTHDNELNEIANTIISIDDDGVKKEIIRDVSGESIQIKPNKFSKLILNKLLINRLISNYRYNLITILFFVITFILVLLTTNISDINVNKIEAKEIIKNNYNRIVLSGEINDLPYSNNVYLYENENDQIRLNIREKNTNLFYTSSDNNLITSSKIVEEKIFGNNISNKYEIVITEYLYELIKENGVLLSNNTLLVPKEKEELLNNKTYLNNVEVKIVGILEQNIEQFNFLKQVKQINGLNASNKYYKFIDEIIENNFIYISKELENELNYKNKTLQKKYTYVYNIKEFLDIKEKYKYSSITITTPYTSNLLEINHVIDLLKNIGTVSSLVLLIICIIQLIKQIKDIYRTNKKSNYKLSLIGIKNVYILNIVEICIPILIALIISVIINIGVTNIINEIIKLYFYIDFNIL